MKEPSNRSHPICIFTHRDLPDVGVVAKWNAKELDELLFRLSGWDIFSGVTSCAKEPYKRDYILQKRPIILRTLYRITCMYSDRY